MAKKLLKPEDIVSIKDAIEDVTFTFFAEHIGYYRHVGTLDRWNEDRDVKADFKPYSLLGLVEFGSLKSDEAKDTEVGRTDDQSIKVYLAFRDLKAAGLTQGNCVIMNVATDYFEYEGKKYTLDSAVTEGFFDAEPVLVLIRGVCMEERT